MAGLLGRLVEVNGGVEAVATQVGVNRSHLAEAHQLEPPAHRSVQSERGRRSVPVPRRLQVAGSAQAARWAVILDVDSELERGGAGAADPFEETTFDHLQGRRSSGTGSCS